MTDSTLRVAIVGAGVIGEIHADAICRSASFTVGAIVNRDPAKAELLADRVEQQTGTRPAVFGALDDAWDRCDVVSICTPSGTHSELAIAAIRAGKHTLIEKPIDVRLDRAMAIHRAVQDAPGVQCSVISQHRFDPASTIVRSAIEQGRLGRLTSGVALLPWWRSDGYYASASWRGTRLLDGGGALMNQGIHTLDLMLWMLGPVRSVQAQQGLLGHEGLEVEDTLGATLVFESGAIGVLLVSTAAYPQIPARVQVHGTRGTATIEGDRLEYFHSSSEDRAGVRHDSAGGENMAARELAAIDAHEVAMGDSHGRQYEDFAMAIRRGDSPLVTTAEAIQTLATVDALYRSALTGESVDVSLEPGS